MAHVPLAQIEEQCLRIYRHVLDAADLRSTDDLALAGGDSVKAVLIATELEAAFGVEVPMATFYEKKSVTELATWLADALSAGRRLDPT